MNARFPLQDVHVAFHEVVRPSPFNIKYMTCENEKPYRQLIMEPVVYSCPTNRRCRNASATGNGGVGDGSIHESSHASYVRYQKGKKMLTFKMYGQ